MSDHRHLWRCECGLTYQGSFIGSSECQVEGCVQPATAVNAITLGMCGHSLCKLHENGPCARCRQLAGETIPPTSACFPVNR